LDTRSSVNLSFSPIAFEGTVGDLDHQPALMSERMSRSETLVGSSYDRQIRFRLASVCGDRELTLNEKIEWYLLVQPIGQEPNDVTVHGSMIHFFDNPSFKQLHVILRSQNPQLPKLLVLGYGKAAQWPWGRNCRSPLGIRIGQIT
jgi:hypothetical protein